MSKRADASAYSIIPTNYINCVSLKGPWTRNVRMFGGPLRSNDQAPLPCVQSLIEKRSELEDSSE